MHSAWLSSTFLMLYKFLQIKERGPNFWLEPVVWMIWSSVLYFNFKSFKDLKSLSFIRFQCILLDPRVPFSRFWNFNKIKREGPNFLGAGVGGMGRDQFCRKSELFSPPFCISILKSLAKQILFHSLDFNAFFMSQKRFCQTSEISPN